MGSSRQFSPALTTLTFSFNSSTFLLLKGQFDAEGSPPSREVAQGTNTDSTDPALDDVIRVAHRKRLYHKREAVMWLLLDSHINVVALRRPYQDLVRDVGKAHIRAKVLVPCLQT